MFDKTKIKNKLQVNAQPYVHMGREYLLSLRDIRNVGVLVFTVIVLLISWSGIKAIQTNYGLQKQVSTLQQQNDVAKLQNQNLQLENQYFNTPQYLDVAARQNLGLAAAGETELLVPSQVALAHTVKPQQDSTKAVTVPKQPVWQRNFQGWVDFFLGRGTSN